MDYFLARDLIGLNLISTVAGKATSSSLSLILIISYPSFSIATAISVIFFAVILFSFFQFALDCCFGLAAPNIGIFIFSNSDASFPE